MKTVKKCPYLRQRPDSAVYHFRLRIPADLVKHYAKPSGEISFSLHTKDLTQANRLAIEHAIRLEAEFARLRADAQPRGVTYLTELNADRLIPALAAYVRALVLAVDDQARTEGLANSPIALAFTAPLRSLLLGNPKDPEAMFRAWCGTINYEINLARKGYAIGDNSIIDPLLDTCLSTLVIVVDRKSGLYQQLRRQFLTGYLEALKGAAERNAGTVVETPKVPADVISMGRNTAPKGPQNSASRGPSLPDLYDAWVRERGTNVRTAMAVRGVVDDFIKQTGKHWCQRRLKTDPLSSESSE